MAAKLFCTSAGLLCSCSPVGPAAQQAPDKGPTFCCGALPPRALPGTALPEEAQALENGVRHQSCTWHRLRITSVSCRCPVCHKCSSMAGTEEWVALPLLLCSSFHPHTPNWNSLPPKKAVIKTVIKTAPSVAM